MIFSKKIFVLLIFLSNVLGAQTVDSVNFSLSGQSLSEKSDAYYSVANDYLKKDFRISLKYANLALITSKAVGDSYRIVKAGRLKSFVYRRLNEIDSSVVLGTEILALARANNYTDDVKSLLNGLAYAYISKAKYDKALTYLFESLEMRKQGGDKFEISVALHNIGLVYYKLEDFDKALSYYKQSFRFKTEIANKYDFDVLMVNMALCYVNKDLPFEALRYVEKGFSQCEGSCSENFLLQAHFCLGVIAFDRKNFFNAEEHFLKSYNLAKEMDDERFQLDNIIYLSEIYIESNQISKAQHYLRVAEELINRNSPYSYESIRIYSQYINLYKKNKNLRQVALYQDKYISLNDSIFGAKLTANMMKIEAKYLEKDYQSRIQSQNKILKLNEEIIQKQKVANASIIGITVLIVLLTIVLAKNNRQNKKLNGLLDQKVKERTQELEVSKNTLQRAWQEREIMIAKASGEIHSTIATIRGLSYISARELHHSIADEYRNELEMTSNRLNAVLTKIQSSSEISSSQQFRN